MFLKEFFKCFVKGKKCQRILLMIQKFFLMILIETILMKKISHEENSDEELSHEGNSDEEN